MQTARPSENDGFYINPEKKSLSFRKGRTDDSIIQTDDQTGRKPQKGYLITITSIQRSGAGKIVLSFKIGKCGKKIGGKSLTEGSQNIGSRRPILFQSTRPKKLRCTRSCASRPDLKAGYTAHRSDFRIPWPWELFRLFRRRSLSWCGKPDYPGEESSLQSVDRKRKRSSEQLDPGGRLYISGERLWRGKRQFHKRGECLDFRGFAWY